MGWKNFIQRVRNIVAITGTSLKLHNGMNRYQAVVNGPYNEGLLNIIVSSHNEFLEFTIILYQFTANVLGYDGAVVSIVSDIL